MRVRVRVRVRVRDRVRVRVRSDHLEKHLVRERQPIDPRGDQGLVRVRVS